MRSSSVPHYVFHEVDKLRFLPWNVFMLLNSVEYVFDIRVKVSVLLQNLSEVGDPRILSLLPFVSLNIWKLHQIEIRRGPKEWGFRELV